MEYITYSARETQALGQKIASSLILGTPICLYGDLGSGKTVMVRGIAARLGVTTTLSSPTFQIIKTYSIPKSKIRRLYHVDLYRMEHAQNLKTLGIEELFQDREAVVIVEWADKLSHLLPSDRIDIHLTDNQENIRKVRIEKKGVFSNHG